MRTRISDKKGAIRKDGIGATLELEYRPSRNRKSRDPNPRTDNLHWIQRVITNYPIGSSPGVHESYIDNRTKQSNNTYSNATHPYYASGSQIKPENQTDYGWFGDRPYRVDNLNRNYYWIAELYLAQADKSNPFDITIYNGVRWGWTYEFIPKEDGCKLVSSNGGACPAPPPPPDCNGGSGGGGCYATDFLESNEIENESQYQSLSFFDFDYFQYTTIPESTPAIGLITLGAWAIVKTLKRKN